MALVVGPAGAESVLGAKYSVAVSPSQGQVELTHGGTGAPPPYTITVTNASATTLDPAPLLGSADVTYPEAFTNITFQGNVVVSGASRTKSWSVTVDGNVVRFRAATPADALEPGESVQADTGATNPDAIGVYELGTAASADGLTSDLLPYDAQERTPEIEIFHAACYLFPCGANSPSNTTVEVKPAQSGASLNGNSIGINVGALTRFGNETPLSPTDVCTARNAKLHVVTIVPYTQSQAGYNGQLDVSFAYNKSVAPGTGVANFRFCAREDDDRDPLTVEPWYEVKNCGDPVRPKCIYKRNRTGVGDLVIKAYFNWADPDWGGFG